MKRKFFLAKVIELNPNDRVVATTTLTLPRDGRGPIQAKSVIEAVPDENAIPMEVVENDSPKKVSPTKKISPTKKVSPAITPTPSAPLIGN